MPLYILSCRFLIVGRMGLNLKLGEISDAPAALPTSSSAWSEIGRNSGVGTDEG